MDEHEVVSPTVEELPCYPDHHAEELVWGQSNDSPCRRQASRVLVSPEIGCMADAAQETASHRKMLNDSPCIESALCKVAEGIGASRSGTLPPEVIRRLP